jgi:CubicO group peptidase (beta-lactamase class C family)
VGGCGGDPFVPTTDVRYETPNQLDDGWATASAEERGLEVDSLDSLLDALDDGALGPVRSLLVARDGALVLEWYSDGIDAAVLQPVYSVTKSVVGLLVGLAVGDGALDLDRSLPELLPGRTDLIAEDSAKAAVRLRDLLDMRVGLDWDEWTCSYDAECNDGTRMTRANDWVAFVLGRTMAETPGTRFVYSSGVTMLLGEALLEATGVGPAEYARTRLFDPLGIDTARWLPAGPGDVVPSVSGGLMLRPRDMLKIGQVMLERGAWRGRAVLASTWLADMVDDPPRATVVDFYRRQWWMRPLRMGPHPVESPGAIVHASGFAGQHIFVIRRLGIVVVITADNPDGSSTGFAVLARLLAAVRP